VEDAQPSLAPLPPQEYPSRGIVEELQAELAEVKKQLKIERSRNTREVNKQQTSEAEDASKKEETQDKEK
jgi:hypothetical protein